MSQRDEELELLRLRARAKAKAEQEALDESMYSEEVPESGYAPRFAPTEEEMLEARKQETSLGETAAASWIESTMLKKPMAAAQALVDDSVESGKEGQSFYDNYRSKLADIDRDIDIAQAANPKTAFAADIAGTTASMALGGMGVGAVAGKTLTGAGVAAATGVGVGALQEVSRAEDAGLSDVAYGAAIGVASEVGGRYIGKGVKKVGEKISAASRERGFAAAKKILNLGQGKRQSELLNKHLARTGQTEEEFISNILTQRMKDGKPVINFKDKGNVMLDKIKFQKEQVGKKLGAMYRQIDDTVTIEIDPRKVQSKLVNDVVKPMLDSSNPATRKAGEQLLTFVNGIKEGASEITEEILEDGSKKITQKFIPDPSARWNLTRLWEEQKDLRSQINSIYNSVSDATSIEKKQTLNQIASALGDYVDETIEGAEMAMRNAPKQIGKAGKGGGELKYLKEVKEARKSYGNLSRVETSVMDKAWKQAQGSPGLTQQILQARRVAIMAGGRGLAGTALSLSFNEIAAHPMTPVYIAKGLGKLGKVIENAPTGRIASGLMAASELSPDNYNDALYGSIAEINLRQVPVKRSVDDMRLRQEDIRNYIKYQSPDLLSQYDELIEGDSDEAMAMFLDGMSKMEGISRLIEPGIGIDGKVYSPEDKAQLETQIKQTDIPAAQRMQLLQELRKEGLIPDFDQIIPEEPVQHVPRNRKIQDY